MKVKFYCGKGDTNIHGTQSVGEPWNKETVRGPKLCCIDLLESIREREQCNPEGGKSRARFYKRVIFYFPSGAWWHFDIALVKPY